MTCLYVQDSGVMDLLSDGLHQPMTVFLPSDDVMASLPPEQKHFLFHQDHQTQLVEYLKYHVLSAQKVRKIKIIPSTGCHLAMRRARCLHGHLTTIKSWLSIWSHSPTIGWLENLNPCVFEFVWMVCVSGDLPRCIPAPHLGQAPPPCPWMVTFLLFSLNLFLDLRWKSGPFWLCSDSAGFVTLLQLWRDGCHCKYG